MTFIISSFIFFMHRTGDSNASTILLTVPSGRSRSQTSFIGDIGFLPHALESFLCSERPFLRRSAFSFFFLAASLANASSISWRGAPSIYFIYAYDTGGKVYLLQPALSRPTS